MLGDFDDDGDVDLADYIRMTQCFTGPGGPTAPDCDVEDEESAPCIAAGTVQLPSECEAGDLDGDGDIDSSDLIAFQGAFTGTGTGGGGAGGGGGVVDQCPSDPAKDAPGVCGCGVPDDDTDGDTVLDCEDNAPFIFNHDQADTDEDGIGDVADNCPLTPNPEQADADQDEIGDRCDNCPRVPNVEQKDADANGIGDACQIDATSSGDPVPPSADGIASEERSTFQESRTTTTVWAPGSLCGPLGMTPLAVALIGLYAGKPGRGLAGRSSRAGAARH